MTHSLHSSDQLGRQFHRQLGRPQPHARDTQGDSSRPVLVPLGCAARPASCCCCRRWSGALCWPVSVLFGLLLRCTYRPAGRLSSAPDALLVPGASRPCCGPLPTTMAGPGVWWSPATACLFYFREQRKLHCLPCVLFDATGLRDMLKPATSSAARNDRSVPNPPSPWIRQPKCRTEKRSAEGARSNPAPRQGPGP